MCLLDQAAFLQQQLNVGALGLFQNHLQKLPLLEAQLDIGDGLLVDGVVAGPQQLPDIVLAAASIPVRMEYSVVKMVSLGVSANWPRKAKFTLPSGTTRGRSDLHLGWKKALI